VTRGLRGKGGGGWGEACKGEEAASVNRQDGITWSKAVNFESRSTDAGSETQI
jgi:hypothetical protein